MTRRLAATALLLGALVSSTGCQGTFNRLKANYATKQGNEQYKAGEFLKAIEWYRYATYLNSELDIAYYHSALSYLALYRPGSKHPKDVRYSQQAIANLKRYLAVHPDSEDAKNYLLTVYLGAERFDEAAQFFEAELKAKGSDDPEAASKMMQIIGVIYTKMGTSTPRSSGTRSARISRRRTRRSCTPSGSSAGIRSTRAGCSSSWRGVTS